MLQKQNISQLRPNGGSWALGSAVSSALAASFLQKKTSNLILEISEQLQPT